MPKASFAAQDAYEPKAGLQDGWVGCTGAKTAVFQYPANRESGEQLPPFLAAVLTFQMLDAQGNPTEDEEVERALRIEKDLTKMRPGIAENREDPEPSDAGDELDTEGNCIYIEEGTKINANCAWSVFVRSLEKAGFDSKILREGYLPDLVGLKCHVTTVKGEKRNIAGREVEPSYLTVDKIIYKPYEGKTSATKKAAGKATAGTNNKPSGSATEASKAAAKPTATAGSDEVDAAATALIAELAVDLAGETRDKEKVYAMAYSRLLRTKDRDRKLDKQVNELLKDEDWLTAKGVELELYTFDGDKITFSGNGAAAA